MDNRDFKLSEIVRIVQKGQNPDKLWQLNTKEVEKLKEMGYIAVPELYVIKTRSTSCREKLMKEINSAYKTGCKKLYKRLNEYQKQLLDVLGVEYLPFKYKVK